MNKKDRIKILRADGIEYSVYPGEVLLSDDFTLTDLLKEHQALIIENKQLKIDQQKYFENLDKRYNKLDERLSELEIFTLD